VGGLARRTGLAFRTLRRVRRLISPPQQRAARVDQQPNNLGNSPWRARDLVDVATRVPMRLVTNDLLRTTLLRGLEVAGDEHARSGQGDVFANCKCGAWVADQNLAVMLDREAARGNGGQSRQSFTHRSRSLPTTSHATRVLRVVWSYGVKLRRQFEQSVPACSIIDVRDPLPACSRTVL
jgi:hypothetical protein